ncbi:hypothetical protein DYL59_30375 [Pseudomonas kairouanensis]|uniref:DUF6933 domain-containing protein n=1 Tax=Pseudomonas kairouanensis TaxID=2293832 RepID=A0A4Z0ACY9_9PSED|nr:hypothetical protein [Pseudomonas kairouanensis]TFY84203.1 hypothetical protein DYL59_30375 [Pseudomonas kairouanensis]
MLTFNCSQAACDFFSRTHKGKKITSVEKPAVVETQDPALQSDSDQWLVHAATVQRKHVLLVIHLKTRYCMLFFDMKKADSAAFIHAFASRWEEGVANLAMRCEMLDKLDPEGCKRLLDDSLESYRLVQRTHRSSQTQLNEILRNFKWNAEDFDFVTRPWSAQRYDAGINGTPRSIPGIEGYGFPDKEMLVHFLVTLGGVDASTVKEAREKYLKHVRSLPTP